MKYQSELINEILEVRGHKKSSLHYESECIESWIEENKGAYPKLCDYQSEWLNYINENIGIGEFPYATLTDVTDATINNVVPFAYKSTILKGNTIINLVNNFTFGIGVEETDNYFTLTQTNTAENIGVNIETSLIELNKDYTLIYFIQEKTTTVSTSLVVKQASYLAPSGNATLTQNIGWNKIKFNLSSFGSNRGLNIAIASSEQDGNYIKFAKNKFALLAGDWTNKNIPFNTVKYGMQSVKTPVLTTTNGDGTRTNILSVSEDVTLRGIGDVQDTLDCLTGEMTERIGEVVLDGSENWKTFKQGRYYLNNILNNVNRPIQSKINFKCDKLKPISYKEEYDGTLGISLFENTNYDFIIRTDIQTIEEFKQWLSNNPTTVHYQLATESIKTVDLKTINEKGESVYFMPIEGTMHVTSSGETITPTFDMSVPVEATTQNLASFIALEMEE